MITVEASKAYSSSSYLGCRIARFDNVHRSSRTRALRIVFYWLHWDQSIIQEDQAERSDTIPIVDQYQANTLISDSCRNTACSRTSMLGPANATEITDVSVLIETSRGLMYRSTGVERSDCVVLLKPEEAHRKR